MNRLREYITLSCAVAIGLALAVPVQGAGSFDYKTELRPILAQQPRILQLLEGSFEIEPSGSANRIGIRVNPLLGGKRVGPYHILAKLKFGECGQSREIVVHTEHRFRDKAGNPTNVENAVAVEEELLKVEVVPARRG